MEWGGDACVAHGRLVQSPGEQDAGDASVPTLLPCRPRPYETNPLPCSFHKIPVQLYQRLTQVGLPIALPSLIRFQLRQLVRSEMAAFEQHLFSRWRANGLPPERQATQFEEILTLTDTLISVLHRKLLYQV